MGSDRTGRRSSDITLRAMCGNAVGMTAFVLVYLYAADLAVAAVAALLVGAVGYVGSGVLVDRWDL